MPRHTIAVGNVTVTSLSDGRLEMPVTSFFPSVPRADWDPYRDELTVEGNIALNVGSFLVRSQAKTILVDTGLGGSDRGFGDAVFGGLLDDLRANAVDVEDVDLVFITHLHRDHVGWNLTQDTDRVRPTFPKARYLLPRADWDVYTRRDGLSAFAYIREQVTPSGGSGRPRSDRGRARGHRRGYVAAHSGPHARPYQPSALLARRARRHTGRRRTPSGAGAGDRLEPAGGRRPGDVDGEPARTHGPDRARRCGGRLRPLPGARLRPPRPRQGPPILAGAVMTGYDREKKCTRSI